MTVVTHLGRPIALCEICYQTVAASGAVVYPSPNGRSHFPVPRAYCNDSCRERGERDHVGPTVTVDWPTFLRDLSEAS